MGKKKATQPSDSKMGKPKSAAGSSAKKEKGGRGRPKKSGKVELTKVQKTVGSPFPSASSTPKRKPKSSKSATPPAPKAQTSKSSKSSPSEKAKRSRKPKSVPVVEPSGRARRSATGKVQNSTSISKPKPVIHEPMDVVDSNHSGGKNNDSWFRSCSIM